jgi:hypothetical protein
MTNSADVDTLQSECRVLFDKLVQAQTKIRNKLKAYSDGKNLKGDELVGWLGEIYGKLLLNGTLVHDREEHDFVTPAGMRVSVKTRKGTNTGWRTTSAIPKIEGNECPTHLLFVHLRHDYSLDRMWLFTWQRLLQERRFREHKVRGARRSWVFALDETKDGKYVVYHRDA